jgi:hypothetical protein
MTAEADVDALVQQGIELRRVGDDAQALSTFEQARTLAPTSVRVRVHLAATHQALGHWLEAEQQLADLLRETEDEYVLRHRVTLEKAYEFVSARIGSLDVSGGAVGADVLLNGRQLGTLPLPAPLRVPIGSYVLEVRKDGYYAVSRPVTISGHGFLREAVELVPRPTSHSGHVLVRAAAPAGNEPSGGSRRWLTWTFVGLGAGAGVAGVSAWILREHYARRWNSDQCLAPNQSRGAVCGDVLASGRTAEGVAYASGVGAALLLGGALTSWLLEAPSLDRAAARATGCGLGAAGVGCVGSF